MIVAQEWINGAKSVSLETGEAEAGATVSGTHRSSGFKNFALTAFLPAGYPYSVTPDYLGFQAWDTVQALSSYIRGMLSSQAILVGVGVGQSGATALGAVFQFFVRDLAGMLGGILFATWQGSGLDSYAKQWRIFADCLNDLGMTIELASPLFPGAFLLLACLGSVARAVTGVAGGATRAALTQHFAKQRNAADIAAKEGSQETATTMAGMILGMALTKLAASSQSTAWVTFLLLTWVHIWANVRALRCLQMTSLNRPRLDLLLAHFWRQGTVLTPAEMAGRESLLAPPLLRLGQQLGWARAQPPISIAPPLASLAPPLQRQLAAALSSPEQQQQQQQGSSRQRYLVLCEVPQKGKDQGILGALVLLRLGTTGQDILQAYCAAQLEVLGLLISGAQSGESTPPAAAGVADAAWRVGGPASPADQRRLAEFVSGLAAAGWACDRVALLQGESRLTWGADLRRE